MRSNQNSADSRTKLSANSQVRPSFAFSHSILILIFIACASCGQERSVHLTDDVDPDIVLINFEEGDRAFFGNLLLTIDSCKPKLIAIDAWFVQEKDPYQDSVLINALRIVENDILGYTLDSAGQPLKSLDKFREHASAEGLAIVNKIDGLSSHFYPITTINNVAHESFPLVIVKKANPSFVAEFERDVMIPINFTRTIDQFVHFNGSQLTTRDNFDDLKDKIVILGYLGPTNEDKHFTPIRQVIQYDEGEPDTYGPVIIANKIRTILENRE